MVIMPISSSFRRMLYNKLIYTAVTRAKEKLIIVGDPQAFIYGIKNDYVENRKLGPLVPSGEAEICDENENGLSLEFNVKNAKEGTIVELPYIYYLGYSANMNDNGENKKIDTFESENGFVAIKIGENVENAHIKIRYSGTILEKAGYVISAVSILGIVCFEIFNKRKSK